MANSNRLSHKSLAQQVADKLRHWILNGQLAGGDFIRQEEIAQELGVSRFPVREALTILESEGLVIKQAFRGTIVAEVSLNDIKEIYALRELLEEYLLKHAIPNTTENDLQYLEEIVRKSTRCSSDEEWAQLNTEFHLALYKPSNLPMTLQTLEQLVRRADRYFRLQQTMSDTLRESSTKQHQNIIDQIRAGDSDAATAALKDHIKWNSDEVRGVIIQSKKPEEI